MLEKNDTMSQSDAATQPTWAECVKKFRQKATYDNLQPLVFECFTKNKSGEVVARGIWNVFLYGVLGMKHSEAKYWDVDVNISRIFNLKIDVWRKMKAGRKDISEVAEKMMNDAEIVSQEKKDSLPALNNLYTTNASTDVEKFLLLLVGRQEDDGLILDIMFQHLDNMVRNNHKDDRHETVIKFFLDAAAQCLQTNLCCFFSNLKSDDAEDDFDWSCMEKIVVTGCDPRETIDPKWLEYDKYMYRDPKLDLYNNLINTITFMVFAPNQKVEHRVALLAATSVPCQLALCDTLHKNNEISLDLIDNDGKGIKSPDDLAIAEIKSGVATNVEYENFCWSSLQRLRTLLYRRSRLENVLWYAQDKPAASRKFTLFRDAVKNRDKTESFWAALVPQLAQETTVEEAKDKMNAQLLMAFEQIFTNDEPPRYIDQSTWDAYDPRQETNRKKKIGIRSDYRITDQNRQEFKELVSTRVALPLEAFYMQTLAFALQTTIVIISGKESSVCEESLNLNNPHVEVSCYYAPPKDMEYMDYIARRKDAVQTRIPVADNFENIIETIRNACFLVCSDSTRSKERTDFTDIYAMVPHGMTLALYLVDGKLRETIAQGKHKDGFTAHEATLQRIGDIIEEDFLKDPSTHVSARFSTIDAELCQKLAALGVRHSASARFVDIDAALCKRLITLGVAMLGVQKRKRADGTWVDHNDSQCSPPQTDDESGSGDPNLHGIWGERAQTRHQKHSSGDESDGGSESDGRWKPTEPPEKRQKTWKWQPLQENMFDDAKSHYGDHWTEKGFFVARDKEKEKDGVKKVVKEYKFYKEALDYFTELKNDRDHRWCYEMIRGDQPCKLFFDIEWQVFQKDLFLAWKKMITLEKNPEEFDAAFRKYLNGVIDEFFDPKRAQEIARIKYFKQQLTSYINYVAQFNVMDKRQFEPNWIVLRSNYFDAEAEKNKANRETIEKMITKTKFHTMNETQWEKFGKNIKGLLVNGNSFKVSYHVILENVHMINSTVEGKENLLVKTFVYDFFNWYKIDIQQMMFMGKPIVDLGVYTKNRVYRTLGCAKLGSESYLELIENWGTGDEKAVSLDKVKDPRFLQTLASYIPPASESNVWKIDKEFGAGRYDGALNTQIVKENIQKALEDDLRKNIVKRNPVLKRHDATYEQH